MSTQRLLDRFLRYVQIATDADDSTSDYPSSPGQWTLGKLLVQELKDIGIEDVVHDQFGLVYATLPAAGSSAAGSSAPVIAFNAHLDTSPETSGAHVQAQVIENYAGGDIVLKGDSQKVIEVAECPALRNMQGRTLITTDGTTLLGGDDKAGLAIIMECVERLIENPSQRHAPLRILFTCDEEIGRGVQHVDLEQLGAHVAYTFDGDGAGNIDVETFSADVATVTVEGVNIHPSIAKDRMVNALRASAMFISRLPAEMTPESTSGRQGFLHPYHIEGGVEKVTLKIILRDFETSNLEGQAELLRRLATETEVEVTGSKVKVDIRVQYRNLKEGLAKEPRAATVAKKAHEQLEFPFGLSIVRGGTDGSLLTEQGLPTPNLSSGQHNQHSPLEWACLDEMEQAVQVGLKILELWADER
jgi:tripeptide aminopeptidase